MRDHVLHQGFSGVNALPFYTLRPLLPLALLCPFPVTAYGSDFSIGLLCFLLPDTLKVLRYIQ